MATHSSVLAWRIPWMEEPGRLQSMGLQSRTRLKWRSSSTNNTFFFFWFHFWVYDLSMSNLITTPLPNSSILAITLSLINWSELFSHQIFSKTWNIYSRSSPKVKLQLVPLWQLATLLFMTIYIGSTLSLVL